MIFLLPNEKNPRLNASGYPDPTAYKAVKHVGKEEAERERQVNEYIHIVKALEEGRVLEGISVMVMKDIVTGKEYRE